MTHPAFRRIDHRPWPHPTSRWTWRQNWYDLLFAHWPVPAAALRHLVPAGLNIQEFGDTSYVGVVPFRMTGVMRRPFPDLPGISAFPELNVRLYVEHDGKPGVWFLSLDASNPLAVWAARRYFHLPYWRSHIQFVAADDRFRFHAERRGSPVRFSASYRPTSESFEGKPGTLEAFLVERYCLYAQSWRGDLYRCDVHHVPWPLQTAEAEVDAGDLLQSHGITCTGPPPLLHFSRGVEVVVWSLEKLAAK